MTKDALTPREIEVLRLLARGLSDEQIAVTLTIARGTASNHVSDIIHKLGAANRLAAVVVAVQRGIIAIPPPKKRERT